MEKILYLPAEWDEEYCISTQLAFHIRESYGQVKYAHLWYERFLNGLLDCNFLVRKVDPCLIMINNMICLVYVYGCIYCLNLKYDINKVMNYFKEYKTGEIIHILSLFQ